MSPHNSSSPSSRTSSLSGRSSASSCGTPGLNMQGTERTHKSATRAVFKHHTQQNSEVNKESWAAEISEKISLVNEPLQDFFKDYVPCYSEFNDSRPWNDPTEVFKAVPRSGRETTKYRHLVDGLERLVSDFDDVRRPKFADGSKCVVPFPFKEWEEEHHYTLPDILMSFPGEHDDDDSWPQTWHRIAMVFEVKNADDPINESAPWPSVRRTRTATGVLTQLAKSARNLMLTHGMLFVFVVGIYKDSARIYRFDRAGCVVSKSFNIKTKPWPLHELLWRICHYEAPVGGLPNGPLVPRLLGEDPTLFRASEEDRYLANAKCEETGQHPLSADEQRACRWLTVAQYDSDGSLKGSTRILLYRVRSLNPRLFSRATVVWEGYEEGTWKRVAVKDAWRQVARDREDAFYYQIHDRMRNRSWSDILEDYKFLHRNNGERQVPKSPFDAFKFGAQGTRDLPPEMEELLVEAALDPVIGELFGLTIMKNGDDLGARQVAESAKSEGDSYILPARYEFYHRTISRSVRDVPRGGGDPEYNERSHMRLVFETVGRPLSQFRSTKELIRGFRDAIYGHRQAYRAGIIHRDISESNVMLSGDFMSFFVGFLLDFDYGFNWMQLLQRAGWEVSEESWRLYVEEYDRNLPQRWRYPATSEPEIPLMGAVSQDGASEEDKEALENWKTRMKLKERTGTLYFMAIEILETHVAHDVRHDLESFFWLLLWVVLRYTATTCLPSNELYATIFGAQMESVSASVKTNFLIKDMSWEVKGNKPLTTLIEKYRQLCYMSMRKPSNSLDPFVPLTYEAVLDIFDEALADDNWPQDDTALPFKMPTNIVTSATQGGSRTSNSRSEGKREAPGDEDPLSLPPHKRMHIHRRPRPGTNPHGTNQAAGPQG